MASLFASTQLIQVEDISSDDGGEPRRKIHRISPEVLQQAIRANEIEIEQARRDLQLLNAENERLKKISALLPLTTSLKEDGIDPDFGARLRQRRSSLAFKVRRAAGVVLKQANRPLPGDVLFHELLKLSAIPEGTSLKAVLKIMWNSPEFLKRDGMYWFDDGGNH